MIEEIKKIGFKLLVVVAFLVAFNWVYKEFLLERDLQRFTTSINDIRRGAEGTEILYIGESSNITSKDSDKDKRPISGFLGDFYPDINVNDITIPAAHSGIYKTVLEYIDDNPTIQTVVVTLNLRSFNANWMYSDLETPLRESMVLLKDNPPLWNRTLLSFKGYDIKTKKERLEQVRQRWTEDTFNLPFDFEYKNIMEWDDAIAKNGVLDSSGAYDTLATSVATNLVKTYAFRLDTIHNPRIKDFNEIITLCKENNWNLCLHLIAENTQKVDSIFGEDLSYFMKDNHSRLVKYFSTKGVTLCDNFYSANHNEFIDQDWATEHYDETARKRIASKLAKSLESLHPEDYIAVDYADFQQSEFYNDCEDKNYWGQMNSVTNEKAYSGNYSSKIGDGQKFSITLEHTPDMIPDSLFNSIDVSFMTLMEQQNSGAQIAFEALGDSIEYFWKGYPLKDKISASKEWQEVSHKFLIPESFRKAEIIKVYVYNKEEDVVFVDDLRISFR